MRLRRVLVYSTLLGSVALGAATAGLDPIALRTRFFQWAEFACERMHVDACPQLRSKEQSQPEAVASNRRPWTDPPAHEEPAPAAPASPWRDIGGGQVTAGPADVATTGGLPAVPSVRTSPAGEPKPDAPVAIGPADPPAPGEAEEELETVNSDPEPDPAIIRSSLPADRDPDRTPVPVPPVRPASPVQANLGEPPPVVDGEVAPATRSDGTSAVRKVDQPSGAVVHDKRRPSRSVIRPKGGPSDPSSVSGRRSTGERILARTGRDPGQSPTLSKHRSVQLPERLLPSDLP